MFEGASKMAKQLERPDWVENGAKTQAMINRVITLWEMQRLGLLDLSHGSKKELVELFGVSRMALDRALGAVVDARPEVDKVLRRVDPNYLAKQATAEQLARQRFDQRSEPGAWLDETQYNEVLQLAGMPPEGAR
jgi:hypothetical protein